LTFDLDAEVVGLGAGCELFALAFANRDMSAPSHSAAPAIRRPVISAMPG
jgi:hypothetical protein